MTDAVDLAEAVLQKHHEEDVKARVLAQRSSISKENNDDDNAVDEEAAVEGQRLVVDVEQVGAADAVGGHLAAAQGCHRVGDASSRLLVQAGQHVALDATAEAGSGRGLCPQRSCSGPGCLTLPGT